MAEVQPGALTTGPYRKEDGKSVGNKLIVSDLAILRTAALQNHMYIKYNVSAFFF
jgi:hypothetical protein